MSDIIPQEPKTKPPLVTKGRLLIYVIVAVVILVVGLFLTPSFPDELIGEVILGLVVLFIEISKKVKSINNDG